MQNCDFNSLGTAMRCPVNLTPLVDAVHLDPCSHKISAVAFEQMKAIAQRERTNLKCPSCRKQIEKATPHFLEKSRCCMIRQLQLLHLLVESMFLNMWK